MTHGMRDEAAEALCEECDATPQVALLQKKHSAGSVCS